MWAYAVVFGLEILLQECFLLYDIHVYLLEEVCSAETDKAVLTAKIQDLEGYCVISSGLLNCF